LVFSIDFVAALEHLQLEAGLTHHPAVRTDADALVSLDESPLQPEALVSDFHGFLFVIGVLDVGAADSKLEYGVRARPAHRARGVLSKAAVFVVLLDFKDVLKHVGKLLLAFIGVEDFVDELVFTLEDLIELGVFHAGHADLRRQLVLQFARKLDDGLFVVADFFGGILFDPVEQGLHQLFFVDVQVVVLDEPF